MLTRDFKDTVRPRARRDPAFRRALLLEGIECLLAGDVETGKIVLHNYINATIDFEELGSRTARQPKGLIHMFGPAGNPQARNLIQAVALLQDHEGIHMEVKASNQLGSTCFKSVVH